ncbi:MAG: YqgE/AlgH family protein [Bacteroidota bacterium]
MDYFSTDQIIEPERGDLLISEPYLPDPNFTRTVVYLCEHDENGTFGLVLNNKANVGLGEVLDEVEDYKADLFVGGPVQQDTLHYIHRSGELADSARLIKNDVFWGGEYDKLLQLLNTKSIDQQDIRFFVGYSGWAPDQLMDELKEKSWIVLKGASAEMIFDWDNHDLWKECLKTMGGKFRLMSNYPKDPRMN